jgi:hypothetical protein
MSQQTLTHPTLTEAFVDSGEDGWPEILTVADVVEVIDHDQLGTIAIP